MLRLALVAAGVMLVPTMVGVSTAGEPTRAEVGAKNAASQAAVLTLQARVEATVRFDPTRAYIEPGKPPEISYVIDYTRAGDKERNKEQGHLGVRDIIREEGKGGSEFTPHVGQRTHPGARISGKEGFTPYFGVWNLALFRLPWVEKSLSQLLEQADVESVKTKKEAGRSLIQIVARDSRGRYEAYVDPSVNYLVRKFIADCNLQAGTSRLEYEVSSFREVKPGIFFPEKMGHTLIPNGTWFERSEVTLSNIRVNEKLPPNTFQHVFPPGTRVVDEVKNLFYYVGANGRPGKIEPLILVQGTAPAAVSPPSAAQPLPATSTPLTAEDGWPWHRFVLIGSAIAVVVGLGLIFWRRSRAPAIG